jgi:hypothetical protein
VNAANRPESPRIWNPSSDKPLYFYSESLDMNFPVSRLDWSDWYRALRAASPDLDDEDLLAVLLRNASMETRFPEDPWFDMPWYERENYIAEAVITAGWVPPDHQSTEHVPDGQPAAEELQSQSVLAEVTEMDRDAWGNWYANVSTKNPQLDDLHLLGELIHATSFATHETGIPEPEQHRYLARAIMSAAWTPPAEVPGLQGPQR